MCICMSGCVLVIEALPVCCVCVEGTRDCFVFRSPLSLNEVKILFISYSVAVFLSPVIGMEFAHDLSPMLG